jgi:hypothetical protein
MRHSRSRFAASAVRLAAVVATGAASASPAAATTIAPLADPHLVDRAAIVAAVTVEAKLGVVGDRPATEWMVVVDRVLKGRLDGSRVVVRLPGGERADGTALHIYGTPAFRAGLAAILFLQPRPDGTYALADFPQGAFLAARSARRTLALRDFSEVKIVTSGRTGSREPLRDFDRFADWIEDRGRGVRRLPDYVVSPTRSELSTIVAPFTLFTENGFNLRWFQFDSSQSVTWRTHTTPMPGLAGGGATEFQRALAVWNNESTTPIRLVYGGTTGATGGLNSFDSTNAVLWTDPNGEIAGTFDCAAGGTLAIGGPWYNSSSRATFNGKSYIRIQGGDIVFNDGVHCKNGSSPNFSKFIEEVSAHEIGHTLGIGHSSEFAREPNFLLADALMYYRAHDDARGGRLNGDDIAALQTLYRKGGSGGTPPKPPPAGGGCPAGTPADTLCLLKGRFQITGTWQNQFDGSVGVTKPITNSDLSGFFYFTDPSNVELIVKILDFGTEIKVFYSQLTNLKFTLSVKDTATGKVKNYTNTAGDCGAIDPNFGAGSASLAAASLDNLPAAAGSCAASSSTLCLLDNRFAVTVDWRNQFNGAAGAGKPKTLSRFTGAFAFDDPANLEILIKTLDFGDKILVLYGSLSNFEYTLRVTDTLSGKTKEYRNPAGNYCGGLDPQF